jgi:hypothetical protein
VGRQIADAGDGAQQTNGSVSGNSAAGSRFQDSELRRLIPAKPNGGSPAGWFKRRRFFVAAEFGDIYTVGSKVRFLASADDVRRAGSRPLRLMKRLSKSVAVICALTIGTSIGRADVITFLNNGPSSNRVDIVFLGDGYTSSQLGTYQTHINAMMNHFFLDGEDPFPRYQNYFNAHRIDVISQQSGADDPNVGLVVNTALDATYRFDGVTQRLLYVNNTKANAALNSGLNGAFTADMKLVTVNATQYGGGGGVYAVYAGGNTFATEVALHELGHSFSGLADEYFSPGTYTGPEINQPNVTIDPTGAKWSEWIGYSEPGMGTIGAYEGARYFEDGLYRPSLDSKMRSLDRPFDAVSREEFILDFYRIVDPLDSWLNNLTPLLDPSSLWVDSIDPSIIKHQWYVNGLLVAGATGESFDPRMYGYGAGTYTVMSHNYDDTPWVRRNLNLLQQDVSWNVSYSAVPEPSSFLMVAGAAGYAWIQRRRRRCGKSVTATASC